MRPEDSRSGALRLAVPPSPNPCSLLAITLANVSSQILLDLKKKIIMQCDVFKCSTQFEHYILFSNILCYCMNLAIALLIGPRQCQHFTSLG